MGHRKPRKRKQQAAADGEAPEPAERREPYSNAHGQDPARALVAASADGSLIAAACGSSLRVFNCREGKAVELPEAQQQHPIRALAFDAAGKLLLAAGDDKALQVWRCSDWSLQLRVVAAKRISAAAFSADGGHVFLADKFGDVLSAPVPPRSSQPAAGGVADMQPSFLLGHFSSIVTALVPSPDGRWLASTDREGKARVSILPRHLEQGAPCIRSFCMGHASFVTAAAFLSLRRLLTASGDGSLRLWDPANGRQLAMFSTTPHTKAAAAATEGQDAVEVPASRAGDAGAGPSAEPAAGHAVLESGCRGAGATEGEEGEDGEESEPGRKLEELPPAVLALAVLPDRQTLAAAVEGEDALFLLSASGDRLQLTGRLAVPGTRLPNSLAADSSGRLLAVGGCEGRTPFSLGCTTVTQDGEGANTADIGQLRAGLGATAAGEGPLDTEGPGLQVSLELRKWVYSEEEMARRKRNRADLRQEAQ